MREPFLFLRGKSSGLRAPGLPHRGGRFRKIQHFAQKNLAALVTKYHELNFSNWAKYHEIFSSPPLIRKFEKVLNFVYTIYRKIKNRRHCPSRI